MISRISLSPSKYVCARTRPETEGTRVGARSMEPVRGFERSQTELQEAIFARYIDNGTQATQGFIKSQETRALCGRVARSIFLSFSRHLSSLQSMNEQPFFLSSFFPKLSIKRVSASAQIFPFRWISRLVHYGGMEIAWNCRLRMQIGYTSVWNEPLSWWNRGELIRGQYCVKGFFSLPLFLITELKGTSEGGKKLLCNWIRRNFCYNLSEIWMCERRRKKVVVNISCFSNFGMNSMEKIVFENYRIYSTCYSMKNVSFQYENYGTF